MDKRTDKDQDLINLGNALREFRLNGARTIMNGCSSFYRGLVEGFQGSIGTATAGVWTTGALFLTDGHWIIFLVFLAIGIYIQSRFYEDGKQIKAMRYRIDRMDETLLSQDFIIIDQLREIHSLEKQLKEQMGHNGRLWEELNELKNNDPKFKAPPGTKLL